MAHQNVDRSTVRDRDHAGECIFAGRGARLRPSGRGLLAGGGSGLMVFGIVAARLSPEWVTGAAEGLLRVLRGLGFTEAVIFAVLQTFVAVSGILPASLLGVVAAAI